MSHDEGIEIMLPHNALASPAPAANAPQAPYEPGLGQMMFGNATGELDLGASERYVADKLYELSEMIGKKNPDAQAHGFLGASGVTVRTSRTMSLRCIRTGGVIAPAASMRRISHGRRRIPIQKIAFSVGIGSRRNALNAKMFRSISGITS